MSKGQENGYPMQPKAELRTRSVNKSHEHGKTLLRAGV